MAVIQIANGTPPYDPGVSGLGIATLQNPPVLVNSQLVSIEVGTTTYNYITSTNGLTDTNYSIALFFQTEQPFSPNVPSGATINVSMSGYLSNGSNNTINAGVLNYPTLYL